MRVRFLVIGVGFSFVLASGTELLAAEPKDGDACKVTSGANQGKVGTYTEGATWCEGNWGGTECKDAQGNSKCTSKSSVHHFPPGVVAAINAYFEVADSSDPQKLKDWETKFKAKAKKTGSVVVITARNKTITFDGDAQKLAKQFKEEQEESPKTQR